MACRVEEDSLCGKKCYDYGIEECKHSLLVVGPTGAGKSAFCNFILGEKRFEEATGFIAGTGKADHCVIRSGFGDMLVVDSPGFSDPRRTTDEVIEEICKEATLCRGGMDAIGIVIDPTSRFTETQKQAFEQMDLFGGEFWKYAFIIFNRENDILEDFGSSDGRAVIIQMMNDPNCPEAFKSFLDKVDSRFIFVESKKRREDQVYREEVKNSLLAVILQLKENNQGRNFNCFIEQARIRRIAMETEIGALKEQMRLI